MADPETVLPLLRERAVYIKDIGTGQDGANFINRSFKGILRLSPNDSNTYIEKPTDTVYTDLPQEYVNFDDATYNRLSRQFLRVSTSDGYFLDMRVSTQGVEYTNLYVTGAMKINTALQLFATDDAYSFKLGNTLISTSYNRNDTYKVKSGKEYTPVNEDTINDTYLFMNSGTADGSISFVNAKEMISELIQNSLMGLGSVPTGSIQFVPVDLTQYKALLDKSVNSGGGHNITNDNNDSLIRDYLLCDGSYYRVTDFPELAKILYKEQVTYWAPSDNDVISGETAKMYYKKLNTSTAEKSNNNYILEDFTNKDKSKEDVRVFRVPDLRAQFIQSLIPGLEMSELKDKNGNLINAPGAHEIDSMRDVSFSIENGEDNHYHYIVLDTNSYRQNNTHFVSNVINYAKICNNPSSGFATLATSTPGALTRWGGIGPGGANVRQAICDDGCECRSCAYQNSIYDANTSPIYPPTINVSKCYSGSVGGGYILSTITKSELDNMKETDWVGVSSWPIDMSVSQGDLNGLSSNNLNYTTDRENNIYHYNKEYVDYTNSMKEMMGYENVPEFYAVLPLIKI